MGMLGEWLPAGGGPIEALLLGAIFVSVLLLVIGASALLSPGDSVERRLSVAAPDPVSARPQRDAGLRVAVERPPAGGLWGFLLPRNDRERSRARQLLWRAGFEGPHAVRNYFALRALLAVLLPLPLILAVLLTSLRIGGDSVPLGLPGMRAPGTLLVVLLLVCVGFYGPMVVVRLRVDSRCQAMRRAFPNALDLLQLAVEAGLGVDSAIARVAEEMMLAHPALGREFALIIVELRAGKPREAVLADFAERTGVAEVRSFVTVLQQTVEFGTDIADALQVFASEMRQKRMLAAEEQANKLSVKLSAVVVMVMMPAIFALILGPIVIRTVRVILPTLAAS
jgi:tight adherence protein C